MKKLKLRILKGLNIIALTLIILLIPYVILKGCSLFTSDNMRQTLDQLVKEFTSDLGISTIKNNSPLLKYTYDRNSGNTNSIIQYIIELFPINKYIINAKSKESNFGIGSIQDNSYIKDVSAKKSNTEKEDIARIFSNTYIANTYGGRLNNTSKGNSMLTLNNMLNKGDISLIEGETYYEDETSSFDDKQESAEAISSGIGTTYSLNQLKDFDFLMNTFFNVDSSTKAVKSVFDVKKLLEKDLLIDSDHSLPQILIFHTHSQEKFLDEETGKERGSVVDVGEYLAELLENEYSIKVIHDKEEYDVIDGKLDRNKAYNVASEKIPIILKKYPSIEVVIDLHRDEGSKRMAVINGKDTAQIMLFNGLSRNQNGPVEYLYNPYITDNLAFSLRLKLQMDKNYPNLAKKIYLKGYRYNLNLMPKSLLIELGTQKNTLEEAKNAMEPFAKTLYEVLTNEE